MMGSGLVLMASGDSLEHMQQSSLAAIDAVDPLIKATTRLAATQGAGALSSRAIGELAGASASAINYRFGSLAGLVSASTAAGDKARADAWARARRQLGELSLRPDDFAPAAYTTLRQHCLALPGEDNLFWHAAIASCRRQAPLPDIGANEAELEFWRQLVARCSIPLQLAEPMTCFAQALRFSWQVFETPELFDPWAMALITRFAARAAGEAPATAADSAWRQFAETEAELEGGPPKSDHPSARRIVEATISLIMSEGAAAANHRSIAARAELSVSSVQHFFGTRRAILLAAFRQIFEAARNRTLAPQLPVGTLEANELFNTLSTGRHTDLGAFEADFAAMHGLILAASEHQGTRPIAKGLVARMGATSMGLLGALKNPRGAIGRLDGQILSMTLGQTAILGLVDRDAAKAGAAGDPMTHFGEVLLDSLFV